jgi:hypothetical protein
MLFSSYRKDQYDDPDSFMLQLGMVLEQYPDEVCRFVTDPRTGIQRRIKWPPTISEIVEACDEHAGHLARVQRFENWGRGNELLLEGPKQAQPTREELIEKYGPNFGLEGNSTTPLFVEKQAPDWDRIAATYSPERLAVLLGRLPASPVFSTES